MDMSRSGNNQWFVRLTQLKVAFVFHLAVYINPREKIKILYFDNGIQIWKDIVQGNKINMLFNLLTNFNCFTLAALLFIAHTWILTWQFISIINRCISTKCLICCGTSQQTTLILRSDANLYFAFLSHYSNVNDICILYIFVIFSPNPQKDSLIINKQWF